MKATPLAERRCKGVSAGHTLLVATQDVLAARAAAIPVAAYAYTDIDIASSGTVSAINGNVDIRAPVRSVAAPSMVDIDVDIGASLRFITRAHLAAAIAFTLRCVPLASLVLCRTCAFPVTIASAGIGPLAGAVLAASTGAFFLALLHFLHCSGGVAGGGPGRERHHLVSAYGHGECRRRGTQYQQISHLIHSLFSVFAPVAREPWHERRDGTEVAKLTTFAEARSK